MISLLVSLFANLWIYKIFGANFILAILLILSSIFLLKKKKIFLIFFLPVIFYQIYKTDRTSLTVIANDDRRVIDMRLRSYPPKVLRFGYWLEERKESIIFNRISANFFENIDPNLYFFANHPRQRVGIKEFEKFPFILFPLFLFGILNILSKKNNGLLWISFLVPVIILSIIGSKNNLGSFSLFPFFSTSIYEGLKILSPKRLLLLVAFLVLVLIQIISYEIS